MSDAVASEQSPDDAPPPRRLIGQVPHLLLLAAPRVVAESIRARLEGLKIPVYLETPFTAFGLPEAYMGTYIGDVSLWVPEALYADAEMILERDHGEAAHEEGEPT